MKIKYIDSKKLIFDDDREYAFLESNPPLSSWKIDDDYDIRERGEGKGIKTDMVINKSQKYQERMVVYSGCGISKGYNPEDKFGKNYPDEWLGREWRIKDLLVEEGLILVADPSPSGSKWQPLGIANANVSSLKIGQTIQISKGIVMKKMYKMEILGTDIPPFDVSFDGWEKSKF